MPPEEPSPSIAEAITPLPHQHAPPHVYLDDTWTIITASTYQQAPYLVSDRANILVSTRIGENSPVNNERFIEVVINYALLGAIIGAFVSLIYWLWSQRKGSKKRFQSILL